MPAPAAFDILAPAYDEQFTRSLVGNCQRASVRRYLQSFLQGQGSLSILEINCGTGDDALWLSSLGHNVIATDASPEMIAVAKSKLPPEENVSAQFITCAFEDLSTRFHDQQFDLLFSNFSGLNCLSPGELERTGRSIAALVKPGGSLAVVVFGKHTFWEMLWFLPRLQFGSAFRRWTSRAVPVILKENIIQDVYYYPVKKVSRVMKDFRMVDKRPVGLFVPPSYLEGSMRKRPRFFRWLKRREEHWGRASFLAAGADHAYLLFKKETK
ncbi:MAG TPA: class I SAM-dependent methyltransferase [Flavisolibacter sp.]|jgi:ubiquinone/menaquinone biosynthesis C-methylase UbiE